MVDLLECGVGAAEPTAVIRNDLLLSSTRSTLELISLGAFVQGRKATDGSIGRRAFGVLARFWDIMTSAAFHSGEGGGK